MKSLVYSVIIEFCYSTEKRELLYTSYKKNINKNRSDSNGGCDGERLTGNN